MPLAEFRLPAPWDHYLQHIERMSRNFWERERLYKNYVRLQSIDTWRNLRERLLTIEDTLVTDSLKPPLRPFEIFLLHAAAYLYEVGWQETDAPQRSLPERYAASGYRILRSLTPTRQETDLGLFERSDTTIDLLAKLCTAIGTLDLSLPKFGIEEEEPGEEGQMVRLRYLIALLQLADLLFVEGRANEHILYSSSAQDIANIADARLALDPYVSSVYLQKNGLTVYMKVHSSDEYLAERMYALFLEPLRVWWSANWEWLFHDFNFFLTFQKPVINIKYEGGRPLPLSHTCLALKHFLENFQASNVHFPASISELQGSPQSPPPIVSSVEETIDVSYSERNSAFICCSQRDKRFLEDLQTHLQPHIRKYGLHVWDETKMRPGSKWEEEIKKALQETKVAVVLVSAHFLASDFIAEKILPPLLVAAEREGAIILPVILTTCAFDDSDLAQFNSVNGIPAKPLDLMTSGNKSRLWNKVAGYVRDALKA
jgi:hypothetical protein